jgi:excisionase family DNA binding protein
MTADRGLSSPRPVKIEDLPLVLRPEEAWPVLRIGRSAFYDAVRRGEIRVLRIGRSIRVSRAELAHFLGEHSGEPPSVDKDDS